MTGWVTDVRPHLRRASVVVAPLRIGSGTRLKVVEGLAMAKPMVSTTVGCEGIDVHSGEHLLVADAPDDFADAVALLLRDPGLGHRLGAAGHRLAHDHYSWEGAAGQLAGLYDRLGVRASTRAAAGPVDPDTTEILGTIRNCPGTFANFGAFGSVFGARRGRRSGHPSRELTGH